MILEVDELSFQFDDKPLLKRVSFSIARGEIVSLVGRSGAGKSTLFNLLVGINKPGQGKVVAPNISYMMQEDLLLPWRTVLKNVQLLGELGTSESVSKEEAFEALRAMGLEEYADHYPETLSAGMRQRVELARVLCHRCPLLLLDEPFSSLDVATRDKMYSYVKKVQEKNGSTVLLITHDFYDAVSLSDRVLLLQEGTIAKEWHIDHELKQKGKEHLITSLREAI